MTLFISYTFLYRDSLHIIYEISRLTVIAQDNHTQHMCLHLLKIVNVTN